eukprot:2862357-Pyramimonas_sp.AAC.1
MSRVRTVVNSASHDYLPIAVPKTWAADLQLRFLCHRALKLRCRSTLVKTHHNLEQIAGFE